MSKPRATTLDEPIIIDVYCRISRAYDDTLRSVDAQEEACRAEIARHADEGWQVGKVFRDHALSAWNPKVRRPEFDELMARLDSGEADGVMVRNLDRFSRKMAEGERLLAVAKTGRVVVALDGRYDLSTARGQKSFREDMIDATYESDRLSERTTRGKRDKARRGKSNSSYRGFAMPGYEPNGAGWESGDPRTPVDPDQLVAEQDAVRELARCLLAGETWASMARYVNDLGLTTPYGNTWNTTAVRQLLMRPSLAGILLHDGVEVGSLDGDPVLDRETWERVQSVIASRTPGRRPSGRYLLTNLIMCGRCGHPLTGRPRVNAAPYPDGEVARQYWCQKQTGRNTGCGRLSIDQRFADNAVEHMVKETLGDPKHADRLARQAQKAQAAREKITSELSQLEQDADALASKVSTWGLARVDVAMAPLDARIKVLREQRDALGVPERNTTATADVVSRWKGASVDQRRDMIRRAFPDGIVIKPTERRGKAALTDDRFDW